MNDSEAPTHVATPKRRRVGQARRLLALPASMLLASSGCSEAPGTAAGGAATRVDWSALTASSEEPDMHFELSGASPDELDASVDVGEKRTLTESEIADLSARKPAAREEDASPPPSEPTPRQAAVDKAARLTVEAPGEKMLLVVGVKDPPFAWREFRNPALSDEDRLEVADARRAQASEALAPLREKLLAIGAEIRGDAWIVPAFGVFVDASKVAEIDSWPEVSALRDDEPRPMVPQVYYDGNTVRNGMNIPNFYSDSIRGQSGGRAGGAVKLAVFEGPEGMTINHFAFRDTVGTSRVAIQKMCTAAGCSTTTFPVLNGHPNQVLAAAAASIEDGQDVNVTLAAERVRRSGIATKAVLGYYSSDADWPARAKALEQAIVDGVDILNHSYSWGYLNCQVPTDATWNTSLANTFAAGITNIGAAGNDLDNTQCHVTYPAQRREMLAVAATNSSNVAVAYNSAGIASYSNRGGMNITTSSYHAGAYALVDLAAPGCAELLADYTPATATYIYQPACGTSFAAPYVAGAAALFRQRATAVGWDAKLTTVNMLLMGDGWASSSGLLTGSGFDARSGAGRVHMHFPSSTSFGGGSFSWGTSAFTLTQSQEWNRCVNNCNPMPANVTQMKVAMTFSEDDYGNSDDIDLQIDDTCPPGGGTAAVAWDLSYDIRSRVMIPQGSLTGKCLKIRIMSYRSVGTTPVQYAFYYHTGTPD